MASRNGWTLRRQAGQALNGRTLPPLRRAAGETHVTYAAALRRFDADVEQGAAPSQAIRRRPTLYLASLRRDDGSVLTLDANGKVKKTHSDVRNLITTLAELHP